MSKSWSHRADLFRTSFSLVGCDLLQSRGRARRFLSLQEQPSPNSMIFAGFGSKDAWSGFCPTPSFRPSGRPRKPAWRLWPGRQAFGFDRRATKRSFWDDLAGNRPLVEDLDVAGRRARRIIASIPLNEQALDGLDFTYDAERYVYLCPNGKPLRTSC